MKKINKLFSPKTWRKQGKVKSMGMMSLNECFILLTVSSFSLLKQKTKQCLLAGIY